MTRLLRYVTLLTLLCATYASAQTGNTVIRFFPTSPPAGTCAPVQVAVITGSGDPEFGSFYDCKGGAWNKVGPGGGSGSAYATIMDEAIALTQRTTVNFTGAGVTCVDNGGATRTDCTIPGGGSTSPGGADTQVQFNDGGAFGGDAGLVWNKTTNDLTVTGGTVTVVNSDTGHAVNAQSTGNTSAVAGILGEVFVTGDPTITDFAIGVDAEATASQDSGTLADLVAVYVLTDNGAAAGNITRQTGIYVDSPSTGSATVAVAQGILINPQVGGTNNYALHIADQGTGANDYAIKVEGGRSDFGGTFTWTGADPAGQKLQVTSTEVVASDHLFDVAAHGTVASFSGGGFAAIYDGSGTATEVAAIQTFAGMGLSPTAEANLIGLHIFSNDIGAAATALSNYGILIDNQGVTSVNPTAALRIADQGAATAISVEGGNSDLGPDEVEAGIFDADTGYKVAGTAGAGKVLIGDGTNFVPGDPLVQGVVAHDAPAAAISPVLVGGYASATAPSDVSATNDSVRAWYLLNGSQVVNLASGGTLLTGTGSSLNVNVTNTTAISGTVTANQGGAPWTQDLTRWAGTTLGTPTNFGTSPGAVVGGSVNSSVFVGTTAVRTNQTTTATGVVDVNIVGSLGVTNSATNGTFTRLTDNTTAVGVIAGTTALKTDLSSVAGTATSTAASGVQKVGVVGNAGAAMDFAGQNASSPANSLLTGCQFNTSPTTITSTNSSPVQCDNGGNTLVKVNVALPTGSNTIGAVTQASGPWTTNMTQWATTALGTPTNFGTTPGAVVAGSVNSSLFMGTTAARTNQTTTATGVVDVNVVGSLGATNSATNGTFTRITDNTTAVGVISGTTALKTDMSSVAGTATSTVASGIQRVGVGDGTDTAAVSSDNDAAAGTDRFNVNPGIYQTSYRNGTAGTQGRNAAVEIGTDGLLWTANLPAIRPASFRASVIWSPVATSATDILRMPGNASNTVLVTYVMLSCTATTAGVQKVSIIKRSSAGSGGTSSNTTVAPMDSNYSAAVSVPVTYTANPTVGNTVGNIDDVWLGMMAAATAAPNDVYIGNFRQKPVVLRGTAENLVINLNSVSIAGISCAGSVEWIETATITP